MFALIYANLVNRLAIIPHHPAGEDSSVRF